MSTDRFETPFFLGLLIFVAGLVVFIFFPELDIVILGITLAILFYPVYAKLKDRAKLSEGLSALITLILAVIVILAPLVFFGFQIFQEAQGLYVRFLSGGTAPFLQFLNVKLDKLAGPFGINLNQYVIQELGALVGNLGSILSKLASVVWIFFLALFAFYYLLKDGGRLKQAIIRAIPLPEKHTEEIFTKLQEMASSVVRGSLLIAVGYGIVMGLGFFIFGLPNPVLWGAVSVIAALIPVVGVLLVVVPAIASFLLMGNMVSAVGFAVWILVIGVFMENFLRPRLIGRRAKVHPLLLLFSVLGGLEVFGPMGILLGPLALSLLLTLIEIYPQLALERNVPEHKSKTSKK